MFTIRVFCVHVIADYLIARGWYVPNGILMHEGRSAFIARGQKKKIIRIVVIAGDGIGMEVMGKGSGY